MQLTYDSTMFRETFESEFTWLNGFMRNVRRFGYKPAVISPVEKKQWTYEELNADCNRFANAMKRDGVKKADIVMFQLFNSTEFLFSYIAPQKLGAIGNPVNFNLSAGETAEIMSHNRAKVYLYDSEIAETAVQALASRSSCPRDIYYLKTTSKTRTSAIRRSILRHISTTRSCACKPPAPPAHPRAFRSTISTRCSRRMM